MSECDDIESTVGKDTHVNDFLMYAELLRAANFLDINALLDLACLKVTFMLQGKNEEEVSNFPGWFDICSSILH
jgi:hypothetical protein